MTVVRSPESFARYYTVPLNSSQHIFTLLNATEARLDRFDGLFDLTSRKIDVHQTPLFTQILVDIQPNFFFVYPAE